MRRSAEATKNSTQHSKHGFNAPATSTPEDLPKALGGRLVDAAVMARESIATTVTTVSSSFGIQEINSITISDSDTSSSTSAESPPGTLTLFEIGASLEDEQYLFDDDEGRTGDRGRGEHLNRRRRRLEEEEEEIELAGVNTAYDRLKGTDDYEFLTSVSVSGDDTPNTAAAADRSRRKKANVIRESSRGNSIGRDSMTEPDETVMPKRTLRGLRPLSFECLEGLGWGESREGVNLSSSAGIGEINNSEQMRIYRGRGRSESEPQRIPASPRYSDPFDDSGAPSDREQHNLLRQYSSEASSPPPQVFHGWKSNYVPLDKRSWLEVRDKHHRYGKNLRLYFKEWNRIGKPDGSFFKWLSTPDVQLEGCPRHELENDVVHYCQPNERENYALRLDVTDEGRAMLHTVSGDLVNSGPNAWLFVLRDRTIFATDKKTDPPRFHHSSFFGGGYVEAAGMLVAENGVLVTLYPHSGHYRPTNLHLHRLLLFLRQLGVDLSAIQVDAQRVHKVARPDKTSERRIRKMDNPYMVSGRYLLDFFEAKHKWWTSGLFADLCEKAATWNTQGGGSSNMMAGLGDSEARSIGRPPPGPGGHRARMHSGGGATVQIPTPQGDSVRHQKRESSAILSPEGVCEGGVKDADVGRRREEAAEADNDDRGNNSKSGSAMTRAGGGGGGGSCGGGAVGGSGGGVLSRSPPPPRMAYDRE